MNRFILYRVSQRVPGAGNEAHMTGVEADHNTRRPGAEAERNAVRSGAEADRNTVRCGYYVLRHWGDGYRCLGETGIYIGGYVLPRNSLFPVYGNSGQHELVSLLYTKYGRLFTDHIKGRFVVVILKAGRVEIYFDHLGLFRAFYRASGDSFMIAGTVRQLTDAGAPGEPDRVSLAMQALFHRVPGKYTVYKDIFKTTQADCFILDGGAVSHSRYMTHAEIAFKEQTSAEVGIDEFAGLFLDNVSGFNSWLRPESTLITLTGGKDSRTILTALLAAGIKPVGFTYGNAGSRDAVYAGIVAREAGIRHIVAGPATTAEWYRAAAWNIIKTGDPEISIHRSLRHYAFETAAGDAGRKRAFYAGYLGGELLMGIYHDDLIFTNFLMNLWEGESFTRLAEERFKDYYIRADNQLILSAGERMSELACTDMSLPQKMREFHAIFEIGIPHHTQDITLSSLFWDYPCPSYLDIEFIELLFKSRYSFFFRDASTVNPITRHELFSLNMGVQHRLFPGLDRVPFGKRGSYSTGEYLRGPLPWSIVKGFRFLTERKKYPPSFAYGKEYGEFLSGVLNEALAAGSPLSEFYDVRGAVAGLEKLEFPLQEKQLHKYSAIAALHMMNGDIG